ncbi:MAG: bifunctional hydroxymethylpyrimidine kinase/phosphomethylpyrimidine kinase [Paludibacteraceae bacterium]|nr:bifunctional hydroxymethylpyrimidine kinase/phosphomethylpyrimidine kinase [Paludibacteraceae bacterium]
MKLIIITKESFFPEEALWINLLMRQKGVILHLRKPSASETDMETLLQQIDTAHYSRIVLHDHFSLAPKYQLMGIHLNQRNSHIDTHNDYFNHCHISRSCHSIQEVETHKSQCNYVTLSPIFDSISKQGYNASFSFDELTSASKVGTIDHKVIALGGISSSNFTSLSNLGFGGVALLGAIWNQPNIEATIEEINKFFDLYPTYKVLSIAGSDPSGGAGVQADIKTITALGGYAASAITALTVQNTLGVKSVYPIPPSVVAEQVAVVMDDIQPHAIKIGMVKDADIVRTIAQSIKQYAPSFVVYDPVMISTSGHRLIDDNTIEIIENELIPLTSLITPNLHEAEVLLKKEINSISAMKIAAQELALRYHTCVLIKGGHLNGDCMCDILACVDGEIQEFTDHRIPTRNLHGTGCTLSSAIATYMAKSIVFEDDISEQALISSITQAKHYVTSAIQLGSTRNIGKGNGPLWHLI